MTVENHPKCFVCGAPAAFWIDLGDFVVALYPTQAVCLEHLDEVLNNCAYASSKWKRRHRFWTISTCKFVFDSDTLRKIEKRMNEELKRAYGERAYG